MSIFICLPPNDLKLLLMLLLVTQERTVCERNAKYFSFAHN
jgi:hypothetical protein